MPRNGEGTPVGDPSAACLRTGPSQLETIAQIVGMPGELQEKWCFGCSEPFEEKLVDRIGRFEQCRGSIAAITHLAEPRRVRALVRVAFTAIIRP